MRKLYSLYFPILALLSSMTIYAADRPDKVDWGNFQSSWDVGEPNFLKKNSTRTLSQLKEIVENEKIDYKSRVLSLYSVLLSSYEQEKTYLEKHADILIEKLSDISNSAATSYLIRIYNFLGDIESLNVLFKKWLLDCAPSQDNLPSIQKLFQNEVGIEIDSLDDLSQLNPILVLDLMESEFMG